MTALLVVLSLGGLIALLIRNTFRPAVLFFGLLMGYYLFGLIDTETMLHNFVNPSLMALVLLIVISGVDGAGGLFPKQVGIDAAFYGLDIALFRFFEQYRGRSIDVEHGQPKQIYPPFQGDDSALLCGDFRRHDDIDRYFDQSYRQRFRH